MTSAETPTSSTLLDRARNNDHQAWERLVQLYSPLVFRWCRKLGLQLSDIETVGQEVFVSIARHLRNFDRSKTSSSFRAWLRVITRNKIVDLRRREPKESALGGEETHYLFSSVEAVDLQTSSEESCLLLEQAMRIIRDEFSNRDWEIFYKFVGSDTSAKEIAREFGVTPNIVYLVKSRVRKKLREHFDGLLDDDLLD